MIDKLNARPEIARATTSFDNKFPQYLVEVDASRCKRNGISPSDVLSVLSGYIGGNYASNMNRFFQIISCDGTGFSRISLGYGSVE